MNADAAQLHALSVGLILLSSVVSTTELLLVPRRYRGVICSKGRAEDRSRAWISIHAVNLGVAVAGLVALAALGPGGVLKACIVGLTISTFLSYRLRAAGADGADQVRMIALLIFSVCFLLPDSEGQPVALIFLGIQLVLAYTTSGAVKLLSPAWREGNALAGVMSTHSFGLPALAKVMFRHPILSSLGSYSAIAMMLAVPLSFLSPSPVPLLVILGGLLCFHAATAALMGLNDFLLTFPAMFPAAIFLHRMLWSVLAGGASPG